MIRGGDKDILGLGFRINGQEKMRLNYNGNVGIGTTTPSGETQYLWSSWRYKSFVTFNWQWC